MNMLGMMMRKKDANIREGYWFAPKRFGYGATPATVQGWAVTFAYTALIGLVALFIPSVAGKIVVGAILTIGFLILAWKKTDGGWHWRGK